jgi:class 3 adenylate cyclase
VAAGDVATARSAVEELDQLVINFDALAMQAQLELGWGRVLLTEGNPVEAVRHLRRAIEKWGRVVAPFEVAQARALLARALVAVHEDDEAGLEFDAAFKEMSRLGAHREAESIAADLASAAERRSGPTQVRKTFMFTDIVGSTNLAELLGDQAWDHLLRWHDEALRAEFSRHRGEVVNSTGDGFFVAFDSSQEAIDCAISVQQLLAEHRRNTGFAPMVRIGLHTADANRHGADFSGVGVHIAARVAALAGGGEILVTSETLNGSRALVTDQREVELKGVTTPVEVAMIVPN